MMKHWTLALVLLPLALVCLAQDRAVSLATPATPDEPIADVLKRADFLQLADLRATTQSEIAGLLREAEELEKARPDIERQAARINEVSAKVAELEKIAKRSAAEEAQLLSKRTELRYRQEDLRRTPQALAQRAAEIQQLLKSKTALAAQIQRRITEFLSPDHEFKRTMSIVFAALIGAVIIGFFTVAIRDQQIRLAIFAGDAGIQFVTLFSLVIAIILFGITQILEGKELAALLGGLSGYILGRASPRTPAPPQAS